MYDLETARSCYGTGRYLYVAFLCQQAIEKLVKGLYVLYFGAEADRTHNIARIFLKIISNDEVKSGIEKNGIKPDIYNDLFAVLLYYYISERYPSYKEKLSSVIDKEKAIDLLRNTEEAFEWLQSLIQFKK